MTTGAKAAFGTLLKKGDGATAEAFTTIAEVKTIGGLELSTDIIDVTSHSSTGGYREKIGGLLDGGEVTFGINWIPSSATHGYSTGLAKDWEDKTLRNFQIVWPGTTTWSFAAIVSNISPTADVDGVLEAEVTLSVSGKPTLA